MHWSDCETSSDRILGISSNFTFTRLILRGGMDSAVLVRFFGLSLVLTVLKTTAIKVWTPHKHFGPCYCQQGWKEARYLILSRRMTMKMKMKMMTTTTIWSKRRAGKMNILNGGLTS
jgi:hypothetical protein